MIHVDVLLYRLNLSFALGFLGLVLSCLSIALSLSVLEQRETTAVECASCDCEGSHVHP